jgi:serine/threonine-protein kinase
MPEAQPAPPPAPPPDLTGRTLGDYHLLRRLGTGGMGQVYLARQQSLKRDVAVKLLRNDLAADPTALARFQAEAEAVARLNHPNVVHIHQVGEHDGLRYMVLEYVEGRNLRDFLARKGPPDLPVALAVVRQVALALQKAHDRGIVHRDVKPENVLVTRRAEVKVTDFGLSRFFAADRPLNLTQSGVTVGTPLYMSPEQVQGRPTDHRTDLYSLGVTCYHLLTGEPPFQGATAFDVALKHVQERPRPLAELRPDLPADLCALVHRLMAKDPADRHPTALDVLRDLAKVRDGLSAAGPPPAVTLALSASHPNGVSGNGAPSAAVPAAPPGRRGRWALAAAACAAAAAAGAVGYAVTSPPPGPPAAPAAGLPDVRPPERIVAARERELLALLGNRERTPPDEVVRASVELGLLYVRDGRLNDARDRFERLEGERFTTWGGAGPKKAEPNPAATKAAVLSGWLGRAVVLAHRDTAAAAKESNDLVMRAVADGARPPADGKKDKENKYERGYPALAAFLLKHPDLAQAVAEGLNRNALALGAATLPAPQLELLRSPPRAAGKRD